MKKPAIPCDSESTLRASSNDSSSEPFPLWMKIGFWACMVIAVAVVVRRAVALSTTPQPNAPPQLAALDAFFLSHATMTWIHILCAVAFVAMLPFLFWRRTQSSRMFENGFFALGFVVCATAYAMSAYSVGGWVERSAVLVFDTLFVVALARALWLRGRGDEVQQRRWILRAVAVLLGIATTRPVMGVFFATAQATHLTPHQFFGVAFWIGFSINTIAMELWLRFNRSDARRMA
jgi:hypothetical protein